VSGLSSGSHTIVVTMLSGTYTTLDGFGFASPSVTRVNDTDPSIAYSGFSYQGSRGFGDYQDDIHYATTNSSTATYSFTGNFIEVFGEQYTDEGDLGITIDPNTPNRSPPRRARSPQTEGGTPTSPSSPTQASRTAATAS
jgi:hypothetical protein